jgi:hypothetical protein
MEVAGWRWLIVVTLLIAGAVVVMTRAPTIVSDKGKTGAQWQAEHVARTKIRLAAAARAVERYRAETGTLPEVLRDVELEVRTDPWGTDLIYERTAQDHYRLLSAGPDRVRDTEDDIARGVDPTSDAEFDALLRQVAPEQG